MYYFSYYSSDYVMAGKLLVMIHRLLWLLKPIAMIWKNLDEVGWFVGFEKK